MFETCARVAKEVKWGLVFLPGEGCSQKELASRLEQTVKFAQHLRGLGNVLEHLRAKERVKTFPWEGNGFGRRDNVEIVTPTVRRLGTIDGDVINVRKELAKRRGPRSDVGDAN